MSETVIVAIITILGGGILSGGLVTAIFNYKINKDKAKSEEAYNKGKQLSEEINGQVAMWKEISAENKKELEDYKMQSSEKIKNLEQRLAMNDRDFIRMERYILNLIQAFIDSGVKIEKLPERPVLERDKII